MHRVKTLEEAKSKFQTQIVVQQQQVGRFKGYYQEAKKSKDETTIKSAALAYIRNMQTLIAMYMTYGSIFGTSKYERKVSPLIDRIFKVEL